MNVYLHKTAAVIFVFLYLTAMLRPIQPFVEYALNKGYIAEFLCVNKDKPKMQCNGKCHLAKQIKKQQEQEPTKALSVDMENYPIGFITIYSIKESTELPLKNSPLYPYYTWYHFDYYQNTFRPPELA